MKIPVSDNAEVGNRVKFHSCGGQSWQGTGTIVDVIPVLNWNGVRMNVFNVDIDEIEGGTLRTNEGDEVGQYIVLGSGEFVVTAAAKQTICGRGVVKS